MEANRTAADLEKWGEMAERQSIESQIKELMVERLFLKVSPAEIGDEEVLMDAYGLDSVNLFELVAGLEEVYGITFEDDDFDLELFKNVASIAAYVRRKLGQEE